MGALVVYTIGAAVLCTIGAAVPCAAALLALETAGALCAAFGAAVVLRRSAMRFSLYSVSYT